MSAARQRRRHPRFELEAAVLPTFSLGAEVLNMSVAGIGLRTREPMRTGKRLEFTLGHEPDLIHVAGTVQWSRRGRTQRRLDGEVERVYEAGVAFDPEDSPGPGEILAFIGRNAVVEPVPCPSGVYQVEDPDGLSLDSQHPLKVLRLSLAGMLLLTDVGAEPDSTVEIQVQLGDRPFYSCARVVTSLPRPTRAGGGVEMAVELLALGDEGATLLRRFIRHTLETGAAPTS